MWLVTKPSLSFWLDSQHTSDNQQMTQIYHNLLNKCGQNQPPFTYLAIKLCWVASDIAGDQAKHEFFGKNENNPKTAIFLQKGYSELVPTRVTLSALLSN
jgi:hypothetical protein